MTIQILHSIDSLNCIHYIHNLIFERAKQNLNPIDSNLSLDYIRDRIELEYSKAVLEEAIFFTCRLDGELKAGAIFGFSINEITKANEIHIVEVFGDYDTRWFAKELWQQVIESAKCTNSTTIVIELSLNNEKDMRLRNLLMEYGMTVHHHVLRREVSNDNYEIQADNIKLTDDANQKFAIDCLTKGFINTYGTEGSDDIIHEYVLTSYIPLNTDARFSAIGFNMDGDPKVHGMFVVVDSRIQNCKEIRLVDIFVPEERLSGWSTRMWTYIEQRSSNFGIRRAEATLFGNKNLQTSKLVTNLNKSGWTVDRVNLHFYR
ncbi:hypothetical protein [Paenibacillus sp. DMB20]|uniref:hypothetical protein n=1 Tax=Paenibacillus sp. DMB20 TaxID=1642570 RepID=UPI000627F81E|nr:hypothetical protein [Paenibacillus sp. DMB20]KKO53464.1 hypothetical protein XI25_12750 [Paenibacillus sp. DMB20]